MIKIALIGCGSWSYTIIKEIEKHKNFKLISIVCRKNNFLYENIKIYQNIEQMLAENSLDCIYVAADPNVNLQVTHLSKKYKIPLILEKPLANSYLESLEIGMIAEKNNMIIYPNLTNYFSESFVRFRKLTEENFDSIRQIIIYEGNIGPFRKKIHPIWDWGFHSISFLFLLFGNKEFLYPTNKEIKLNNKLGKGIVAKFNFNINKNIFVKVITGNLFKKKIRKIKIILENNDYIESDMILHNLYFNKLKIFSNNKTPISSLLDSFSHSIKDNNYETSKMLIEASGKTIKFLEKFYKC